MKGLTYNILMPFIISGLLTTCAQANRPSSIEISTNRDFIRVGEPLIIKMTYKWEEPIILPETNEASERCPHSAHLIVKKGEEEKSMRLKPFVEPYMLELQGTEGIEYSAHFVFFYDFYNGGLIFSEPGTYTIQMEGYTQVSNSLDVIVKAATEPEQKVLSFLSPDPCDPIDYCLLRGEGFDELKEEMPEEFAERISRLRNLADQCGETLLGKWASGRFGIEEYNEIKKKHNRLGEKFLDMYRSGVIEEPLVERSYNHLLKALELPDEFTIREEVLYNLVGVEFIKGDEHKMRIWEHELSQKYPKGRFSRQLVAKLKGEIEYLEDRVSQFSRDEYWKYIKQLLKENTPIAEADFKGYMEYLSADQLLIAARQCSKDIEQNKPEHWEEASMALGFFYEYYPRKTNNLRSVKPLLDDLRNKQQNVCWRYCIMHLLDAWDEELGMLQSLHSANVMKAILKDASEPSILRVKAAIESGELYRKVHNNNLRQDPKVKRLIENGGKYNDVLRDAKSGKVKLAGRTIEANEKIEASFAELIQPQIEMFSEPNIPVDTRLNLIGSLVKLREYDSSGRIKQAMSEALRNYKDYEERLWFYLARINVVYFDNEEEARSILQQMIDEVKSEHEREVNLIRFKKKLDKGEVRREDP